MKCGWSGAGILCGLILAAGYAWGQGSASGTVSDPAIRAKKAVHCLKLADDLEKKNIGGTAVAQAYYRLYLAELRAEATALKSTSPEALTAEKRSVERQRQAATFCIRYGGECPYKSWNFIERKFITEYQTLLMIRPLAVKKRDRQMVDFIDCYTLFLHQELASGMNGNIKENITEPENKEMRQLLASVRGKINDYQQILKKMTSDARAGIQREGAATAAAPPALLTNDGKPIQSKQ